MMNTNAIDLKISSINDNNVKQIIKIKKTKKTSFKITNNSTTETLKKIIEEEDIVKSVSESSKLGFEVLSHLGNYVEEPYSLIESYFKGKHLDRLVRHQIESYNNFINYQVQRTIQMFNPVTIHSENDYVEQFDKYLLEVFISFSNFKLYPPQIHENNGATKTMFPHEAKLRNFTYASTMTVDIKIDYVVRNTETMDSPKTFTKILPKINIGKMPIMLKSSICVLSQKDHVDPSLVGECPMDCGGYFVIKGSEKTVIGQERAAENRVYCFDGKNTTKWSWIAEIKSIPDFKCISPKQIEMMISSKNNGFGNSIHINIPRVKNPIELFAVFRALGVVSDKEICDYILLDIDSERNKEILNFLQASIIDANKYRTKEDSLKHITSSVAYTPINMDKEKGARKKQEFAIDVLNNDLFPHCKTLVQKLYILGYMARKLIMVSFGWIPTDDRDSYINKRIELTGTLLNNLFRNYFNKLVKEMQKQIVREINNGSWRSMDDYENIINMTNIYKIMKSTTIENGINRALSTGDFSIKQSNSSKVGIAQVLNRLTYVAGLSHLRRVNTPIEKSGELIAPRKLHNTTWGFLCAVETPEGQSIGIVKNISYMSHITIPTNSTSLYDYILPHIIKVDDENIKPLDLFGKVKVLINGAWVGVTDNPQDLFLEIKEKKFKGIINIYTSIIFDYKLLSF
jgi:DNA-directed RNA polymerase II subunit RPB2